MPRCVPGGETNLQLLVPNTNGLPRVHRKIGRREHASKFQTVGERGLFCVIVDGAIGRVEEDRSRGVLPNRRNTLNVIEVGMRKVDCLDAASGRSKLLDHRRCAGTGIDHSHLVRSRAAQEVAVLIKRPTVESADLEEPRLINARRLGSQTVKELPHPQPPVAAGLLKVNPAPIMLVT